MSAEVELIHLGHFIEASFGLCIAFTIIDDVHQWGQKMCESFRKKQTDKWDKTKQQANSIKEPIYDTKLIGNAKLILETDENEFTEAMRPIISVLKIITFAFGLWFYALLAFSGSNPSTVWPILAVCIGIYLPATIPLFFIWWIVTRWNKFYMSLRIKAETLNKMASPPA